MGNSMYIVYEGKPDGAFNATNKARKDVEVIALKNGFQLLNIPTVLGVRESKLSKILQYIDYVKNHYTFDSVLSFIDDGSTVLVQYPLNNVVWNLVKVIRKHSKRLNMIALIHDLDSLRLTIGETTSSLRYRRIENEDHNALKAFNHIICHNEVMLSVLKSFGISDNQLVSLDLFDYLCESVKAKNYDLEKPVIIAGNLSKEKAEYLYNLDSIPQEFNLYGMGYSGGEKKNIHYLGSFTPEDLLNEIDGSFGLVWDGKSPFSLTGGFGEYMKFNNPHKASMYLAAGLPIIVSKESAIAGYVMKKRLGICVDSLMDIASAINKLSKDDYHELLINVKKESSLLREGYFFEKALKETMKNN